jgi:hypothetical protein
MLNLSFRSRAWHPGQVANSYIQMVALKSLFGPHLRGWAAPVNAECDGHIGDRLTTKEASGLLAGDNRSRAALQQCSHVTGSMHLSMRIETGSAPCDSPLPSLVAARDSSMLTVVNPEGTLHWRCNEHGGQAGDERSLTRVKGLLHMIDVARAHNHTTWVMNAMYHACHTHARECAGDAKVCAERAKATLRSEAMSRYAAHVLRGVDWLVARDPLSRELLVASGVPRSHVLGPSVDLTAFLPYRLSAELEALYTQHNHAVFAPLLAGRDQRLTLLYVASTNQVAGYAGAMAAVLRQLAKRKTLHVIMYHPPGTTSEIRIRGSWSRAHSLLIEMSMICISLQGYTRSASLLGMNG